MTDRQDTMVLFDWNGTIVLDSDRARRSLNQVLSVRGLDSVNGDDFPVRFKLPMDEMFFELGIPVEELTAAEVEWNDAMASVPSELRVGAIPALTRLHRSGVWLGIVSAAAENAVSFDLRSLEVPPVWSSVATAVANKPAELERRRATRGRAYYVGDTVYDMVSARATGYIPIAVVGGYGSRSALEAAGAQHLVHDLREIEQILAEAGAIR